MLDNLNLEVNLFLGKAEVIGDITSAINKKQLKSTVYLSEQGLDGDECADKKHHGGVDRALHHYPEEHYKFWSDEYPNSPRKWVAPGMGENISSRGLTEDFVYIGDQFKLGNAIIEISQPRSPCFKLNAQWNIKDLSFVMQSNNRCGWLYRVIQSGYIGLDSKLTLINRPKASLTVKEVCNIFFDDPLNYDDLRKLLDLEALSKSWRMKIQDRLKNRMVEDWSKRLFGMQTDA